MLWPVSAKAVIVRGGSVLLARNTRDEWELPGGRVERGEEPAAAAVREVAEETGLLVQTVSQLGVTPFEVVPDRFVLIAAFACTIAEDRELVLSEEHQALHWQPVTELDDIALPEVYRDFIAMALRGRVVLIGDSHLAKLDRHQLHQLSGSTAGLPLVVNHAVGGSSVVDLLAEIELDTFLPQDRIVISIGTNDYAPWKRLALHRFRSAIEELLDRLQHHRLIVLLPPPVDERRQIDSGRANLRTEEDRAPYARALEASATAHEALVVELPAGASIGTDGVHLSDTGCALLIARLAQALDAFG